MLRTLIHYRRVHGAVVAGTAVATAVLAGALLVGDSVRGSLRDLARDGLGGIDQALTTERFVPADLAERLAARPELTGTVVAPAILLTADVRAPESGARASDVGVQGADERLLSLMTGDPQAVDLFGDTRRVFPPAALNETLARELDVAVGDPVLLSLGRWSEIPAASLLGRRETESLVETIRCEVAAILPDHGPGRFSLRPHQAQPRVAWLPLADLQRELGERDRINAVLVGAAADRAEDGASGTSAEGLDRVLAEVVELRDLGLALAAHGDALLVESERFVLRGAVLDAVATIAAELGAPVLPVSTYLANSLALGDGSIPYSTVAALEPGAAGPFGGLRSSAGEPVEHLGADEILLDTWSATELGAAPGDPVELTYYEVGPDEDLREATATFRVRAIVAKEGLAGDAELTQEYPGIADADRMSDWDPPFPVDLGRVRTADEEYWEEWRGTPKAFVALETGRTRWGTVWGDLTQVRIAAPKDRRAEIERTLRSELPRRLDSGLRFEAVRARALDAASGSTDFGQLFLGFSFFLIGAAALLVGLLFRLGVEQRAGEIGLRLAVGTPPRRVRRQLLLEGVVLAAAGAVLGLLGALAYGEAMMAGLRTLWRPAVGTVRLDLHVLPATLAIGWIASVAVVLVAVHRTVRRVGAVPVPRLLAGRSDLPDARPGRTAGRLGWGSLLIATTAIGVGAIHPEGLPPAAFFVGGPALLVALLAALSHSLDRLPVGGLRAARPLALLYLAAGNAARHRGRSVLATTAIAAASFVLVTVAAFRHDFSAEDPAEIPGTGGFDLIAQAEVALQRDLGDPGPRAELGLGDAATTALAESRVVGLARRPGDDASCLNLYRPEQPRILGVPVDAMAQTGFGFAATLDGADPANPWELLRRPGDDGAIPVIGDLASTQWILKLGLGDLLEIPGDDGRPLRLRLVATLDTSVFQSELLMAKDRFREIFPDRPGDGVFLIDLPDAADPDGAATALESDLAAYGLDATRTVDRLADFHTVQNTYLSTFQLLGGLGLLLGTVGLAFVLLRNVLERRGELATLRAVGFRHATLVGLVVLENALLLVAGLLAGASAALVTAAPRLVGGSGHLPWGGLALTLSAVLAAGLVSCLLAAAGSVRGDLTPALKAEA